MSGCDAKMLCGAVLCFSSFLLFSCATAPKDGAAAPAWKSVFAAPQGAETIYSLDLDGTGGSAGCYLMKSGAGFLLVDTGVYSIRGRLLEALAEVGCTPGTLRLVVLTHGHWDHTGSAAYLQRELGVKVVAHERDLTMFETGEVPMNRRFRPFLTEVLAPLFTMLYQSTINDQRDHFETFTPDILIGDELDLRPLGFNATLIHIPGHSGGSIGMLTENGNFLSGDIFVNRGSPAFNDGMADESFEDLDASIAKVKTLSIGMVFPGHGKPFMMSELRK